MFRTWTTTTTIAAILVGAAIALVIPAAAQAGPVDPPTVDPTMRQADHDQTVQQADHDQIVLRRDGDRAVPFDPVIGHGDELVLRRDGSEAVPFVADTNPQAGNSGFDWTYALIAAGSALALVLLAAWALLGARHTRPSLRQRTLH